MAMVPRRCPNADIKIEGAGFLKSGNYVVACRASMQNIASNVAYDVCLSRTGGGFGSACNLCKAGNGGGLIDESKAGWKKCRYASRVYGW
jgi:hypothetical protein